MIWVLNMVIAAFEVYIFMTFFSDRFSRKTPMIPLLMSVIGYVFLICFLRKWDTDFMLLIFFSAIGCSAISVRYRMSWKQRLQFSCLLLILGLIAEMTAGFMLINVSGMNIAADMVSGKQGMANIIGAFTSKLMFFIFVRIVCRLFVRHDHMPSFTNWVAIMMLPLASIMVQHGLALTSVCMEEAFTAVFFILLGMLMINVLVFVIYDLLSKQSKILAEQAHSNSRMKLELRRHSMMITQGKEQASFVHDVRSHFKTIYHLIADQNDIEALQFIKELNIKELIEPISREKIVPEHVSVDMVLRREIARAKRQGISVKHHIFLPTGLPVNDLNLCIILGNALENSIEACCKLEEQRERCIQIDIKYTFNKLSIRIANNSAPVNIIDGRYVLTSKDNVLQHGFGLQNIWEIVKEADGNMVIQYKDEQFILNIIFLL